MWFAIATFIGAVGVPLITNILIGLGMSVVTYNGVSYLTETLQNQIFTNIGGLPADIVQIMGLMNVDGAINIIFSAIAVRATLAGWHANQRRRMRIQPWRAPGGGSSTQLPL